MGPVILGRGQRGAMMIELLISLVLVVVGVLGLIHLQLRLQGTELESLQRTRALFILEDMASRLLINRAHAADYLTDPIAGVGADCEQIPAGDLAARDLAQWCARLSGEAEQIGGLAVGAPLGARGCVQALDETHYQLTVAWRGLRPLAPASEAVSCGKHLFDMPAGSACARRPDYCRRYITTRLPVAGGARP